jgi:hypothetical protein
VVFAERPGGEYLRAPLEKRDAQLVGERGCGGNRICCRLPAFGALASDLHFVNDATTADFTPFYLRLSLRCAFAQSADDLIVNLATASDLAIAPSRCCLSSKKSASENLSCENKEHRCNHYSLVDHWGRAK